MSTHPALDGLTILVVDDNPAVRDAVVEMLAQAGATVLAEESADGALATLIRVRPDVLLSDIAMPGHDGLWLISQVRALPADRGGETPAIALTGHMLGENPAAILSAGFQCCLLKPVGVQDLAMNVSRLARGR